MGLRSNNKVWKKDEMAALIALFETERCLYDDKDKNYYDAEKQLEAYKRICKIMLRIRPDCSVDEIKYKITYLRRQYEGEILHRNISIKSGLCTKDTYRHSMWCFDLLQFLDDFLGETNDADGGANSDVVEESDDEDDEKKSIRKRKVDNSSSPEREMLNISPTVKKLQGSSSEKKLQNASERKFQSMSSSERKFQKMMSSDSKFRNVSSTVKKFRSASSSERKSQVVPSSGKRIRNSSPSEKELKNSSSSEKELKNSSSSERELKNSSSSERELKNSLVFEDELTNNSSGKELLNTSCPKKIIDFMENVPGQTLDREDIFGQYIASELRALRSNPLLYLQTKQSILECLTSANFELLNPE